MPDFQLVGPLTDLSSPDRTAFLKQFSDRLAAADQPRLSTRFTGLALIVLNEVCGTPLAAAWRMVRPDSRSHGPTAEQQASRMIRYYRQRYPLTWQEAFEVSGATPELLVKECMKMLHAKRLRWDNDEGRYVETEFEDMKAKAAGIDRLAKFINMDKEVRERAALGAAEKPSRLDLPPKFATPQEWEVWAKSQEKEVLAQRREAAEDMRAIAEGRRAQRKEAATEPEPEKQPDWP